MVTQSPLAKTGIDPYPIHWPSGPSGSSVWECQTSYHIGAVIVWPTLQATTDMIGQRPPQFWQSVMKRSQGTSGGGSSGPIVASVLLTTTGKTILMSGGASARIPFGNSSNKARKNSWIFLMRNLPLRYYIFKGFAIKPFCL